MKTIIFNTEKLFRGMIYHLLDIDGIVAIDPDSAAEIYRLAHDNELIAKADRQKWQGSSDPYRLRWILDRLRCEAIVKDEIVYLSPKGEGSK